MWRGVRSGAFLTCVTGLAVAVATPAAAAPGFSARFTELPDGFAADGRPATVAVVVSRTDRGNCLKVRWSLVLRAQGLRLDQMRVDRIEEDGSFPVDVRAEGDAARVTDVQLDPGTLCRDRTVTARYRISVAEGAARGRVQLTAEAYDGRLRLLARESATRQVLGDPSPTPSGRTRSPSPEPSAAESEPVEPAVPPTPSGNSGAGGGQQALDPAADNRGSGLPLIGFMVGGLLVFFGAGLLVRTAWRMRRAPAGAPAMVAPDWSRRGTGRGRRTLRF
ncbi:hypothetical protein SAMN05444365_102299 [Micromonospora pattaloongensis]|uniref:Uncharacterized protein n=1 Tax=Micromonospora pattaloongensis TaxID=405436 RepID=A0A1H3JYK7_9ACTN|nr:hypothetical protein [Micromonospora pattaloongensis]SDY44971.1 hypothetical protein SAMN05444365_102299 [Micromonospora pattaloongensis]